MATEDSDSICFGIYGPGRSSITWARHLDSLGPNFWYYSPDGNEMVEVLDAAPRADVQTDAPYFEDGYTDVMIFTGPADPKRSNTIIDALSSGISVICEPPLARTLEELKDIHDAAEANEVCLITAFKTLHTSSYNQLCYWTDNLIGDCHTVFTTWSDPDYGKDPLWDVMPEALAAVGSLFNAPIVNLTAEHGPGWIQVVADDEEGRMFSFNAMSGAPVPEHKLVVVGTHGSIECQPFQEEVILRRKSGQHSKEHGRNAGAHRSLLLLLCQRVQDYKKFGKEQVYGEIGIGVSELLIGIEQSLNDMV